MRVSGYVGCKVLATRRYRHEEYTFNAVLSDGSSTQLVREVIHRPDTAAILPYNKSTGHVLLTKQLRFPRYVSTNAQRGDMVEVPSGGIEAETPVMCAMREAKEEVGATLHSCELAYTGYTSPAVLTEIVYGFIGEYNDRERRPTSREKGEDIEVLDIHLRDALDMIGGGFIADIKTILLLRSLASRE